MPASRPRFVNLSSVMAGTLRRLQLNQRRLLGSTLMAVVATSIAWQTIYQPAELPYVLEVSVHATEPASAQIYFDLGDGLRESNSSSQRIRNGENVVRLGLPAGNFSGLRFDPIDRGGTARFSELRIVGPRGTLVRRIPFAELVPNPQVQGIQLTGETLQMVSTADANDPQFTVTFDPRLELPSRLIDRLITGCRWLAGWFCGSFVILLLVQSTWRNRLRLEACFQWTRRNPRLALALCAGIAATASSYPVVFFGKSFVSPNTSHLLYKDLPSVPGYSDPRAEDARGADVGAMLWQHYPYTVLQSKALEEGSLPLWNRYASCGVTLLGQGQSMVGDPLNFLVVLTGGATWAFDLKYVLVKALFGCGLGWCVWALTRDIAASSILTFASVFIAFFNYRINHPSIFTMGYAPWILVAWLYLTAAVERRSFRNALVLWYAANWMVITSGTVKEAYLLAFALNLTGVALFFTADTSTRQKFQRGLILGLAALAFILATSPLWRSFIAALSSAYTAYNTPGLVQLPGERLIGFFDDLFYRPLTTDRTVHKPAANFLILLGCLWALLQPGRLWASRKAFILFLAALAALSLAVRFGPVAWPSSWILAVPFLRNVYNLDTIFSCIAIVHLCVLAGWGLSAARKPLLDRRETRYGWGMAAVLLALLVPYFIVAPAESSSPHQWLGWSGTVVDRTLLYVYVIALPLAAWTLVILAGRKLRGSPLNYGTAAVALIALLVLLGRHGQHLRMPTTYVAAPGPRADLRTSSPAVAYLQARTKDEPARIQGLERCLFTGFSTTYGFEGVNGANALENRFNREFAIAAQLVTPGQWIYDMSASKLPALRPILDFLNVRFLAEPGKLKLPLPGYQQVASLDLNILESEHPWPRAFFTDQIERYDTPDDLVRRIGEDPRQIPFAAIQQSDPLPLLPDAATEQRGSATIVAATAYKLTNNSTGFTLEAPKAGVAVLHENWLADDFRATLDGKEVPYFRVNHSFKGIVIPNAGSHRIEFTYSPRGFTESLVAAMFGVALMAGSLFGTRCLSFPSASTPPSHARP